MEKATVRSMYYWYGKINRNAFAGRLPKARIEFACSDKWLGQTSKIGTVRFIIRINRRLQFSRTACIQTLVHEMVHVSDWKLPHGRKFGKRIAEVMVRAKIEAFL